MGKNNIQYYYFLIILYLLNLFEIVQNVCDAPCLTCTGGTGNECLSCDVGKWKDNTTCTDCTSPCTACTAAGYNNCSACQAGYAIQNTNFCCAFKCGSCPVDADTCDTCRGDRTNGTACTCATGFYDDGTSENCQACDYNCGECSGSGIGNCTACKGNFRKTLGENCVCLDKYWDNNTNENCQACDKKCASCIVDASTCTACDGTNRSSSFPDCLCNTGYYNDPAQINCQACDYNCGECSGSGINNCTACKGNNRKTLGENCVCLDNYWDNGVNEDCQPCDNKCSSCNVDASTCTACAVDTNRSNSFPDCLCNPGYFDNGTICQACVHPCVNCTSETDCTSCVTGGSANRVALNSVNECQCNDTFYDITTDCISCPYNCTNCSDATTCEQCSDGNRTLGASKDCKCNPTYYDDGSNSTCVSCELPCINCSGNDGLTCESCSDGGATRSNNLPNCECNNGYFENDPITAQCAQCDYQCKTCDQNGQCLSCKDNTNRTLGVNKLCDCDNGWFNVGTTPACSQCHSTCFTCSSGDQANQCDSCADPRFLENGNTCVTTCSTGTGNVSNRTCEACATNCSSCNTPNDPNDCTGCEDTFYISSNSCVACDSPCLKCNAAGTSACTACDTPKFLQNNQCVDTCDDGTYGLTTGDRVCTACATECAICSGGLNTECSACKDTYFYDSSLTKCSTSCPTSTYKDSDNNLCQDCDAKCASCTQAGNTKCDSCTNGNYKDGTVCDTTCTTGKYPNDTGNICSSCDSSCKSCDGPDNNNCLSCPIGKYYNSSLKTCVDDCDPGQYKDSVNLICGDCNGNCEGCDGPNANDCIACNNTSFLKYDDTNGNTCVTTGNCGDGFYEDTTNRLCQVCSSVDCKKCTDGNGCSECNSPLYLYDPNNDGVGNCLETCPQEYFNDTNQCTGCTANCSQCVDGSANQCQKCQSPYFLKLVTATQGTCEIECTTVGQWENEIDRLCDECDTTCETCDGAESNNCLTCTGSVTPYLLEGECLADCPVELFVGIDNICKLCDLTCLSCNGLTSSDCLSCASPKYLHNSQCISVCPSEDSVFPNSTTNECESCEGTCKTCQGNQANNCTSCRSADNLFLYQSQCLATCENGYYKDATLQECMECHVTCTTCDEKTETDCLTCTGDKFLLTSEKTCITFCPEIGFYPDSSDPNSHVCGTCDNLCLECTGSAATQCSACAAGKYLKIDPSDANNKQCLTSCGTGYWIKESNRTCQKCYDGCATCVASTIDTCKTCNSGKYFLNGRCLDACPVKAYYQDGGNNRCNSCDLTCEECSGSTIDDCTYCFVNSYLLKPNDSQPEGKCLSSCPTGYFVDDSLRKCAGCIVNCQICSSPSPATSCTICQIGYFLLNGECHNPCPNYYYGDALTKLCTSCHETCKTCSGSQINQCLSCDVNKYLFQAQCFDDCPAGFYNDNSQWSCLSCDVKCVSCTGPNANECSECFPQYYYFSSTTECRNDCPDEFFEDKNNVKCTACYSGCKKCLDASQNQCTSCNSGKFLHEKQCIDSCPQFYYEDSINNKCKQCHDSCETCNGTESDRCLSCILGKFLLGTECVSGCPNGSFQNDSNRSCDDCHADCFSCSGAAQNECESCNGANYLQGSSCQASCDSGFFGDSSTQTCMDCDSKCTTCFGNGNFQCSSCENGYYLMGSGCDSVCPPGYYTNDTGNVCSPCYSTCKTCTGTADNNCVTCRTGLFLNLTTNRCGLSCEDSYYQDYTTTRCEACYTGCKKCINGEQNQCLSCNSSYYLLNSTQCVTQCPSGKYGDQISLVCVNSCKAGFYGDSNRVCQSCNISCVTCNGAGTSSCLSCPEGKYLHNNECLDDCPAAFYNQQLLGKCGACDASCATCEGKWYFQCLSCVANKYYYYQRCQDDCPTGYFQNQSNPLDLKCTICHYSCQTCNGATDSDCLTCTNFTLFYNGQCLFSCPDTTFPNLNTRQCLDCATGCKKCLGSGVTQCTSCQVGFLLLAGECKDSCPAGQWPNQQLQACYGCHPSCTTCKGGYSTDCTTCNQPYYLEAGECKLKCSDGRYQLATPSRICDSCHDNCETCNGPDFDNCISCNNTRFIYDNVCYLICDALKYFDYTDLVCKSCHSSCQTCFSTQSTGCITCVTNKYLYNNQCIDDCTTIGPLYTGDNTTWKCEFGSCDPSCSTCIAATSTDCTSCAANSYLKDTGECVDQNSCQSGTYPNDLSNLCTKCHPNCLTCTGPDYTECSVCSDQRYLINTTCDSKCNTQGKYENDTGNICSDCATNCISCFGPNSTQCTGCNNSTYLQKTSTTSQCQASCDSGNYSNDDDRSCYKCDESCLECSGPLPSQCTSCSSGKYLGNGICDTDCPTGYYGNDSNNNCDPCDNSCEKCTGPNNNNCTGCNEGDFLQNNQCSNTCTVGFWKNQSTRECSNCDSTCRTCSGATSDTCLSCKPADNLFLDETKCVSSCPERNFANQTTQKCQACFGSCYNCNGPTQFDCTSCDPILYFFNNQCHIECPQGSYTDPETDLCQPCNSSCKACTGPTAQECSKCDTTYLDFLTGECKATCPNGYYADEYYHECRECSTACITCSGNADNCTGSTCAGNRLASTLPDCLCPTRTIYDTPESVCDTCYYRCEVCSNLSFNCIECAENRVQDPPSCPCPTGTYDDGSSIACQDCSFQCTACSGTANACNKCKGDRVSQPTCDCPDGSYEDFESEICPLCHIKCKTCQNTKTECKTCRGNRNHADTSAPDCECPVGTYEDHVSVNCPVCDHKCTACVESLKNCTVCLADRINPPDCVCPQGFYDDGVNETCLPCDITCLTCESSLVCLSCNGNRVGPINGVCECPFGAMDRYDSGSPYCGTCEIGVPDIQMLDDLKTITIDIGHTIFSEEITNKFQATNDNCVGVFTEETLTSFGTQSLPKCIVNQQQDSQIIVNLGEHATILPGDEVSFETNALRWINCTDVFFNDITSNQLKGPSTPAQPDVEFLGPIDGTTLCTQMILRVVDILGAGDRPLENIEWVLQNSASITTQSVRQTLENIVNKATLDQKLSISIPELTLESFQTYTFQMFFTNYMGVSNSRSYTFTVGAKEAPMISIQQDAPHIYYTRDKIELIADVSHLKCTGGSVIEVTESNINVEWTLLSGVNNILEGLTTLQTKESGQLFVQFNIPEFIGRPDEEYELQAEASLPIDGQIAYASSIVNIKILSSDLVSFISGGNRMSGFAVPLNVTGMGRDPDENGEEAQLANLNKDWTCVNMNKNKDCFDTNNDPILMEPFKDQLTMIIPKKTLPPYNAHNIILTISKGERNMTSEVTIIITELDLPQLTLELPSSLLVQKTNLNQEIQINLQYPADKADTLFYAGAFVYKTDVVATMAFEFLDFRFKIWDHFSDFEDSNQMSFRASVYDPAYYMPSQTTIKLLVNIPPSDCVLSITNSPNNLALTEDFNILVEDCVDSDLPLSYRYTYYTSQQLFEDDIETATTLNLNSITDYITENQINTPLPVPTDLTTNNIIVQVQISDGLGGITNMTQAVQVWENPAVTEQNLIDKLNSVQGQIVQEISLLNLFAAGTVNMVAPTLKNQMLPMLKQYRDTVFSKQMQEQLQKSISAVMSGNDIKQEIDYSGIDDQMADTESFFSNMETVQDDLVANSQEGNFKQQRQKEAVNNNILRVAGVMDSLLESSSSKFNEAVRRIRRRIMQETTDENIVKTNLSDAIKNSPEYQQTLALNQQYKGLKNKIVNNTNAFSLPNEKPVAFSGSGMGFQSQKMTPKKLQNKLTSSNEFNDIEVEETLNETEADFDIFDYSMTQFKANPYATDETFPYFDSDSEVFSPGLTNSQGEPVAPENDLSFGFKNLNEKYPKDPDNPEQDPSLVCINDGGTDSSGNQKWGPNSCKTIEKEDSNGNPQYSCECGGIPSATTIVNDIGAFFTESKVGDVFGAAGFEALKNFKFWESLVFWLVFTNFVAYLVGIYYSFKLDKMKKGVQKKDVWNPKLEKKHKEKLVIMKVKEKEAKEKARLKKIENEKKKKLKEIEKAKKKEEQDRKKLLKRNSQDEKVQSINGKIVPEGSMHNSNNQDQGEQLNNITPPLSHKPDIKKPLTPPKPQMKKNSKSISNPSDIVQKSNPTSKEESPKKNIALNKNRKQISIVPQKSQETPKISKERQSAQYPSFAQTQQNFGAKRNTVINKRKSSFIANQDTEQDDISKDKIDLSRKNSITNSNNNLLKSQTNQISELLDQNKGNNRQTINLDYSARNSKEFGQQKIDSIQNLPVQKGDQINISDQNNNTDSSLELEKENIKNLPTQQLRKESDDMQVIDMEKQSEVNENKGTEESEKDIFKSNNNNIMLKSASISELNDSIEKDKSNNGFAQPIINEQDEEQIESPDIVQKKRQSNLEVKNIEDMQKSEKKIELKQIPKPQSESNQNQQKNNNNENNNNKQNGTIVIQENGNQVKKQNQQNNQVQNKLISPKNIQNQSQKTTIIKEQTETNLQTKSDLENQIVQRKQSIVLDKNKNLDLNDQEIKSVSSSKKSSKRQSQKKSFLIDVDKQQDSKIFDELQDEDDDKLINKDQEPRRATNIFIPDFNQLVSKEEDFKRLPIEPQFDQDKKNKNVLIEGVEVKIQEDQEKLVLALMDKKLEINKIYNYSFKINKKVGNIGIGICYNKQMSKTEYIFEKINKLDHGVYSLLSNGTLYSSHDENENQAITEGYKFEEGDIINITINYLFCTIEYSKDGEDDFKFISEIVYKEKDPFHPCILLENKDSVVEFLKAEELEAPVRKIKPTPKSMLVFILVFHELVQIFTVYDQYQTRPIRLTLYYLKILIFLAMTALFPTQGYFIFVLMLSIMTAIMHAIILKSIDVFGQMPNKWGKYVSTVIAVATIGVCLWSIVVSMALTAVEDAELSDGETSGDSEWGFDYLKQYTWDLFMNQSIKSIQGYVICMLYFNYSETPLGKILKLIMDESQTRYLNKTNMNNF